MFEQTVVTGLLNAGVGIALIVTESTTEDPQGLPNRSGFVVFATTTPSVAPIFHWTSTVLVFVGVRNTPLVTFQS